MRCEHITIATTHPCSTAIRTELMILAEFHDVPVDLLIEAFVSNIAHPEGAFPYVNAEDFLSSVINDIHIVSGIRISRCSLIGDVLKIRTDVPMDKFAEWVDG